MLRYPRKDVSEASPTYTYTEMFEARILQAAVLKKLVEALRDLVDIANLECGPDGISLQAMDSSHVCLISLDLSSTGFETYSLPRPFSMGVKMASLSKILKCANNEDSVTMHADEEGDVLSLAFEAPGGGRVSEFSLKLIDIESESLGLPDMTFGATVKMPSAEFLRVIKDLSSIGDTVEINIPSKEFVRFVTTGDIGTAGISCARRWNPADPGESVDIECSTPTKLTFALRYLNSFAKAAPLTEGVSVKLCDEMPMVVEYEVYGVGVLRFYLAPKIDEDCDDDAVEEG